MTYAAVQSYSRQYGGGDVDRDGTMLTLLHARAWRAPAALLSRASALRSHFQRGKLCAFCTGGARTLSALYSISVKNIGQAALSALNVAACAWRSVSGMVGVKRAAKKLKHRDFRTCANACAPLTSPVVCESIAEHKTASWQISRFLLCVVTCNVSAGSDGVRFS